MNSMRGGRLHERPNGGRLLDKSFKKVSQVKRRIKMLRLKMSQIRRTSIFRS